MFAVNRERWMPMGQYIRFVIYTMTHDIPPSIYERHIGPKTQRQRRWGRVLVTDGPIHTLWVWQTVIRYNWFTIGLRCSLKGHEWREQFITFAPEHHNVPVPDKPGYATREKTGRVEKHYITACSHCGHYRGHSSHIVSTLRRIDE